MRRWCFCGVGAFRSIVCLAARRRPKRARCKKPQVARACGSRYLGVLLVGRVPMPRAWQDASVIVTPIVLIALTLFALRSLELDAKFNV